MNSFSYRNGALCAEAMPIAEIAADVGTPFYCYATERLQENYRAFASPFAGLNAMVCFAVKANANQAVIRTLANCGAGADITSVGELERTLQAGVKPEKIIFSGVGKTRDEIRAALLARVHQLNVESIPELRMIGEVAAQLGVVAPILLRVNPDVDAKTHKHLSTGHKETKFGIEWEQLDEALRLATNLSGLAFKGLSIHVGTYVPDYSPFRLAFERLAELVKRLRGEGYVIERLDLGGGVSIPYDGESLPPFADYAALVKEIIAPLGCAIAFEPGRRLVGDAGILVSRVIRVKEGVTKKFVIIDAAMNDLVRPAMYGARHEIIAATDAPAAAKAVDVVGPVCETGDLFGADYRLPELAAGDLVAILQGGAYGCVMASAYNGRALIPEVLVSGAQYAVVRRRIVVAEQIGWEGLPSWLATPCAA